MRKKIKNKNVNINQISIHPFAHYLSDLFV